MSKVAKSPNSDVTQVATTRKRAPRREPTPAEMAERFMKTNGRGVLKEFWAKLEKRVKDGDADAMKFAKEIFYPKGAAVQVNVNQTNNNINAANSERAKNFDDIVRKLEERDRNSPVSAASAMTVDV